MRISSPICALVVGLSASVALAACNGPMPNDVTLPASATPVSLSADPNPIIPEFITQSGCFGSQPFGLRFLLAIGSPDAERFHPTMSTEFLARIGDLVSEAVHAV